MHLSYLSLVAAAMIGATLETTSAASGETLSTSNTVLANVHGNTGHDQRFLRQHKIPNNEEEDEDDTADDVDSQEERGWLESIGLLKNLAGTSGNWDDMMTHFSRVTDHKTFGTLLPTFKNTIEAKFPNFNPGMSDDAFEHMLRSATRASDEEKEVARLTRGKYQALRISAGLD